MKRLIFLIKILIFSIIVNGQEKWQIDNANSNVTFAIQWMQNSFRTGEFKVFSGDIITKKSGVLEDAFIDFKIQVTSIDLIATALMNLVQNEEYLDSRNFPEIEFKSISIKRKHKNVFEVNGNLSIKGITRPAVFTLEDNGVVEYDGRKYGALKATGQFNKSDFKIYGGDKRLGDLILVTAYFETVKVVE